MNNPAARITPHVVMETTEAELQRSVLQQVLEFSIPNAPLSYSLHPLIQPRFTKFAATVFCNDDQIFQISINKCKNADRGVYTGFAFINDIEINLTMGLCLKLTILYLAITKLAAVNIRYYNYRNIF